MKAKFWYIKERHNPQLGVYYVGLGNISQKKAKYYEKSLYGDNYLLKFENEFDYKMKLAELKLAPSSEPQPTTAPCCEGEAPHAGNTGTSA